MQEAGEGRATPLVDLRQVGTAHIHVDARSTPFKRGCCIVPGGGAAAEYGDGFAAKCYKIDVVIGMGGKIGHQSAIDEIRPEYATGSCTAGRQNDPPRQYVSTYPAFIQHGPNEGSCGFECFQRSPMPDWQSQHFLQPGQILNPGPIMNLVKRFPGIDAVFRLIPGTKGERGNAEGGARQHLGRAQRVHPREGQPRPFLPRP